jgi:hypothetical protein
MMALPLIPESNVSPRWSGRVIKCFDRRAAM